MTQIHKICLQLAKAETSADIETILSDFGVLNSPDFWHSFGNDDGNYKTIGNQSARSDRPLIEKITNSIDQTLELECRKRGIDPKGPDAPKSLSKALEDFFNIEEGDLSTVTAAHRSMLAKKIKFIATGNREETNYIIMDEATGQSALTMQNTILSLHKKNKIDMPFTQGEYNQGGTAVLSFCDYQLIISKQHKDCTVEDDITSEDYCFTIVKRERPTGQKKQSVWKYLVSKKHDDGRVELYHFRADNLEIGPDDEGGMYKTNLKHGTFIKLFNYRLRPLGIKKGMLNTRLQFVLASLMPDLGLPVRMYERRNNFQNSKDSNLLGLSTRLKEDRYKKLDEEAIFGSIIVDEISIPYKVYVFKRDTAVGNYKNDQFVIFTLNGQNQGELNQAVLTGKMFSKISYLKQHLLIMVDFSNVPAEYREEIFMVSRDRIKKDTDFYQEFEQRFYKQIAENEVLRRLASKRRAEDIKQRAKKDEDLEEMLKRCIINDPILSKTLTPGNSGLRSFVNVERSKDEFIYEGLKYPTFFELKGNFTREKPKIAKLDDNHFKLRFNTNANNDYFERTDDPGNYTVLLNGEPFFNHSYSLCNGKFNLTIDMPNDRKNEQMDRLEILVNDSSKSRPLANEAYISYELGKTECGTKPNNPRLPQGLSLPEIIPIDKDQWNNENRFDEKSGLYIAGTGKEQIFFINVSNIYLQNELLNKNDEDTEIINNLWRIGLTCMGLTRLSFYESEQKGKNFKDYDVQERIWEDTRCYASTIIPNTYRLYKSLAYGLSEAA